MEQSNCPECGENSQFIPPNKTEKRKLIVDFKCPNGHLFRREFDLK